MLSTIYSFYTTNVTPTLSMLWERIPNLPAEKLPSAKKVALCAFGLFCLYTIYRPYQSLQERLTLVENDLQTAKATNTTLEGRVATLERQLAEQVQKNSALEKRLEEQEYNNTFFDAVEGNDDPSASGDLPATLDIVEEHPPNEADPSSMVIETKPSTTSALDFSHDNFQELGYNALSKEKT